MFQFMLVVGLVLAYYGYAVTKNPRIWGDQGRDAIKEENWFGHPFVSLRPLDARKRGHLEPLAPRGNRKAEAQAPDQRAGAPGKEKQKEIRWLWVT